MRNFICNCANRILYAYIFPLPSIAVPIFFSWCRLMMFLFIFHVNDVLPLFSMKASHYLLLPVYCLISISSCYLGIISYVLSLHWRSPYYFSINATAFFSFLYFSCGCLLDSAGVTRTLRFSYDLFFMSPVYQIRFSLVSLLTPPAPTATLFPFLLVAWPVVPMLVRSYHAVDLCYLTRVSLAMKV